ncbi:MAG: GDSL-type esterase/lipase family protein [Nitrospinales bacterium]
MRKHKQAILFLLILPMSVWAMMSLAGCSGSETIPSASVLTSGEVTLTWQQVPGAAVYNVYLSTSPGVTVLNSYKIAAATNPITITDLEPGTTYYFVVTVEDDSGQSRKSEEISYKVVNTVGSIQLGDILSPSEPDASISKFQKESEDSPADIEPEQEEQEGGSTRSESEAIVCFGDSLTFGTGAGKDMDYPSQLANMIQKPVINRGIPGDTTTSALRRLNRDVLSANPDWVLITLGGNDLKNGVSKDIAFTNLKQIVQTIQNQGARVIIGGLRFPGRDWGFGKGYEDLSQQTGAMLIPDIFAEIVDNPNLMSDPIHPNDSGYRIIARRFYDALVSSDPKQVPKAATLETGTVTLAWDDVSGATSYNIYWSDKPGVTKKT